MKRIFPLFSLSLFPMQKCNSAAIEIFMGSIFHRIEYHLYFFVSICYFHIFISLILLQSDTLSIFLSTIGFSHLLLLCNHRIPEFDVLGIFSNALENSQSRKIIYNLCMLLEDFYYTLSLSN